MPLVEHELPTLPEHPSSPPVFSGVRVTRSLVLCVCFVDRCLSFCPFFFWPLSCLFFFELRLLITSLWYLLTLLVSLSIVVLSKILCCVVVFNYYCYNIRIVFLLENLIGNVSSEKRDYSIKDVIK